MIKEILFSQTTNPENNGEMHASIVRQRENQISMFIHSGIMNPMI